MQTRDIMTLESRRSRGSPAASEWVVRRGVVALAALAFLVAGPGGNLPAQQAGEPVQETAETGNGLIYQRKVQLPQGPALPAIVMTEFFTNGELSASGSSIVVHDSRRNAVPWRILQLGPGDFCRLAFQTVPFPSSTCTSSTTRARASRKSRPPGPIGPVCSWKPGTGRTAT
ncbi:MAG: hypothetical protein WA746_27495 [Isosphaeraceae bacterium]